MTMANERSLVGATQPVAAAPDMADARQVSYPKPLGVMVAVAALYFGRDVLLPLAIAVLLTFMLAPLVSWLRKLKFPRPAAVVTVVIAAFCAISLFGFVVATQLGALAGNVSVYQSNIVAKVQTLKEMNVGEGVIARISKLLERLGREMDGGDEQQEQAPVPGPGGGANVENGTDREPMPVEIVQKPPTPVQVLQSVLGPLVEPLATVGIIIVVVIFMLLKREDMRDRFIRLVGAGDLHRTTEAIQDAGTRLGRYLLMQLVINVTYAIPVGIGLWLIGVPNSPLWAMLALVLRFVPYIGPFIAASFPLALAIAVDPGWTLFLWTGALFIVLELVSNNIMEPWLYGTRTGLSPLAVIVSAIFWTWLWGPLGLLLSTPLTVCLVVLGRHVPQFAFLDVLFGNEPVLEPHQQLYQRLLSGDPEEATDKAEIYLEEHTLARFYDTVGIPALALGESDRARGVMGDERRHRVAQSAATLIDNLAEYAEVDDDEDEDEVGEEEPLPDGTGRTVLCAGGRGELDDAAATMLAQVLAGQGATARAIAAQQIAPGRLSGLDLSAFETVVVGFLNPDSLTHARYAVRRLKRARPKLRVGVVLWGARTDPIDDTKSRAAIGCDFLAHTMTEAVNGALEPDEAVVLPTVKRATRRKKTARAKATA